MLKQVANPPSPSTEEEVTKEALLEYTAAMAQATDEVTNSSGPLHLASVVSVHRWGRYAVPRYRPLVSVRYWSARRCALKPRFERQVFVLGHFACSETIAVNPVLSALRALEQETMT